MHYLVSNDTKSQLKSTLIRYDTGNPINLETKSVSLKFRERGTSTVLFTLTANIVNIDSAEVIFPFGDNLIDLPKGYYEGEIIVSDAEGDEYVYDIEHFHVRESF